MTIKRRCKYCGEIFAPRNIARTVCDNPICKAQSHGTIRKTELLCRVCGKPIPLGSRRFAYCSDECLCISQREQSKMYNRTHTRTHAGCFMDVKAEIVYKPIGEVKI